LLAASIKKMRSLFPTLSLLILLNNTAVFASEVSAQIPEICREAARAQAAGFDPVRLCDVLKDFIADKSNFHSLIIERHGLVIADVYKRGTDKTIYSLFGRETHFDASTPHDLRSISKSVTSLLWGIAQAQHKTPPLNTPVLDLFPDLAYLKNQGRELITIAHLLSMSSGLEWNEPSVYNAANEEIGLYWHSSQAKYVFNRAMLAPAGTRFNYNGGGTAILAQILADRVGMSLSAYARLVLFEPLGITDWEWTNDLRGRPLAFAGLRLRPADLARLGRMILNRGIWKGQQIVPADWLSVSTRAHLDTDDGLQYGYQWWAGNVEAMGAKHAWSAGFGNGGQRLFLIPELDMLVVMTAGAYNKPIGRQNYQYFKRIASSIQNE
jgi:CubicO group peptidase (beta-lactamase class C family)